MSLKKPSKRDVERLRRMLEEVRRSLEEGVEFSERCNLTSHKRILLHLLSHVHVMEESLASEDAG